MPEIAASTETTYAAMSDSIDMRYSPRGGGFVAGGATVSH